MSRVRCGLKTYPCRSYEEESVIQTAYTSTVVLPLQKLIHRHSDICESNSDEEKERFESNRPSRKKKKQENFIQKLFPKSSRQGRYQTAPPRSLDPLSNTLSPTKGLVTAHVGPSSKAPIAQVRTLQRYHGGPNEERIAFMEKHSALASKDLGVGVEQVSIFLTSDNTVISFFESSAEDIETPILARLNTKETILRRTSDASMLTQVSSNR